MSKLIATLVIFGAVLSATAQVKIDKSIASEAVWVHVPSGLKTAIQTVEAAKPDEDGKITVDGAVWKAIQLGATKLDAQKQAAVDAASTAEVRETTKSNVFATLAAGDTSVLPKVMARKFQSMTPEEKKAVRDFLKSALDEQ